MFYDNEFFSEIPEEKKTPDMCMEAVKEMGDNLEFVPEGLKAKEMCRIALVSSPDLGYGDYEILSHIPFPDVCMEGIKQFENNVDMVDIVRALRKEVINKEIADYVVGKDGRCLGLIPLDLQTESLVLKAVRTSGCEALAYTTVREDLKTENLYIMGLVFLPQSFHFIPEHRRTPALCLIAEKRCPDLFQKRPEIVPRDVATGKNVYTFNKILEKATGMKFSVDEIQRIYIGTDFKAKYIQTPEGIKKNQLVHFDKERQEFFLSPLKQEKRKGLKM